jgi:hypothetical protein
MSLKAPKSMKEVHGLSLHKRENLLERMLHKDSDCKGSVAPPHQNKTMVVSLKGLGIKMNWLVVNC